MPSSLCVHVVVFGFGGPGGPGRNGNRPRENLEVSNTMGKLAGTLTIEKSMSLSLFNWLFSRQLFLQGYERMGLWVKH